MEQDPRITPADELRNAAATIRARAETATPGPWARDDDVVYSGGRGAQHIASTSHGDSDARHIVTWSPPVALAVAAWLELTAEGVQGVTEIADARGFVSKHPWSGPEWTLARLINGSGA